MENEKKSGGDKYSKLAGNTLIFAISSFSSKLLTLIVQPFLTYAMAEISDLGLSKILSQYANLLIPFVSMGMSSWSCAGPLHGSCPTWPSTACSFTSMCS